MFRTEEELRAFAMQSFMAYSADGHALSPAEYPYAYLATIGALPSAAEVDVAFGFSIWERSVEDRQNEAFANDTQALLPQDASGAVAKTKRPSQRLFDARIRQQFPTSFKQPEPSPPAPPYVQSASSCRSNEMSSLIPRRKKTLSRSQFVRRMVDVHDIVHGRMWTRDSGESPSAYLASPTNTARLWALFDTLDGDHKGYLCAEDITVALALAAGADGGEAAAAANVSRNPPPPLPCDDGDARRSQSVSDLSDPRTRAQLLRQGRSIVTLCANSGADPHRIQFEDFSRIIGTYLTMDQIDNRQRQ